MTILAAMRFASGQGCFLLGIAEGDYLNAIFSQ
jgi:hypothetical protein